MTIISIIMPTFNAERFLADSIRSVINQTFKMWELLIINDGSTDASESIVENYKDSRIHYFKQNNQGVSAARNLGLSKMKGNYFCFLDADDVLPPDSLYARLDIFQNNDQIYFVDGRVEKKDASLQELMGVYQPNFTGYPLKKLVKLSEDCFFGPSWMIKRKANYHYQFRTDVTHSEDLLFYIDIANHGLYTYTYETILHYRVGHQSAMKNLKGLENGYREVYKTVSQLSEVNAQDKKYLKMRIIRIMFLSYLRAGDLKNALRSGMSLFQL